MSSAADRLNNLANQIDAPQLSGPLLGNQVAIITGSGQGIGRAAALLFAQHGAKVVVTDLDEAKAKDVAQTIVSAGGDAIAFAGNVMDPSFGDKLIKVTVDKYGKINHIVNNAGFTNDKMMHTMDDALFQQMIDCHSMYPPSYIYARLTHFLQRLLLSGFYEPLLPTCASRSLRSAKIVV